jgi:alpha-1,2-glucosyltransferase
MDEIFHIRQTQTYCIQGNWSHWDEKITTLPGLYALATGFARATACVLQPAYNLASFFFLEPFGFNKLLESNSAQENFSASAPELEELEMTERISKLDSKDDFVYEALYSSEMGVVVAEIVRESVNEVVRAKSRILLWLCSVPALRLLTNPTIAIATAYIFHKLLCLNKEATDTGKLHFLRMAVLFTFPLSFFFHFLYYTDTGSLFFILVALYLLESGWHRTSAIPAAIAIFFRQTNAVWVAFILVVHLVKLAYSMNNNGRAIKTSATTASKTETVDSYSLATIVANVAYGVIPDIIRYSLTNFLDLLLKFGLHILLLFGFVAFVIWNGGITVGDRTAHQPVLHLPHILYFLAFTGLFGCFSFMFDASTNGKFSLAPFWRFVTSHIRNCVRNSLSQGSLSVIIMAWLAYAVNQHTMAHPYLLADNRHYTFYVWQRTYQRYEWFKYAMLPVYYVCGWLITSQLMSLASKVLRLPTPENNHPNGTVTLRSQSFMATWIIAFLVFTATTLIPSPLLEFRYFIVPFTLLLLQLLPHNRALPSLLMQLTFNLIINAATFYLFLFRPFEWNNPAEPTARFLW